MRALSRSTCPFGRIALFMLWSAVLLGFASAAQAQSSFSVPSDSCANLSCITLNGDATMQPNTDSATYFELTRSAGNLVSSAWFNNPGGAAATLPLGNGFTSTFTFQLFNQGGIANGSGNRVGADGIAFVIQNGTINGTNGVHALGPDNGAGGQLGYTGLTKSLAVQFDTWCNSEYHDVCAAGGSPTSADAVAVQSCGASANTVNFDGCTLGRVDLSTLTPPIYISDGQSHTAQIAFTPSAAPVGNCGPGTALGPSCGSLTVIVDGRPVLTVALNLSYVGLDTNGDAYVGFTGATGGAYENQDILSWTFNWNSVSVVSQPINTAAPPDLPANFNSALNNVVASDTDYGTASQITSPLTNPQFLSVNTAVSQTNTWPQYVVGTPWATSLCTIKAGNGGTDLCSLYVNACYDKTAGVSTADDFNCPQVVEPTDSNYITLKDTFDWGTGGKQQIAPGTTISLLKFSPSAAGGKWSPSTGTSNPVCTQVASVPNGAQTQCDLTDTAVDVYGDQTTTRGTSPRTKGWLVSVYGVPMPLTHVNLTTPPNSAFTCSASLNNPPANDPDNAANTWNNGGCLLDFSVDPAKAIPPQGQSCDFSIPVDPCNHFQAAPVVSLLYGKGSPAVSPGPIPEGDTQTPNDPASCTGANPCGAQTWTVGLNTPLSSYFGQDGQYILHWAAKDAAGITEKFVRRVDSSTLPSQSCPLPGGAFENGPQCYLTDYFTTKVNIDSYPPHLVSNNSCVQSPAAPNNYGWYKTEVTFVCQAQDDMSGIRGNPNVAPNVPVQFNLSTSVNGSWSANASTNVQQYCDLATNCSSFQNGGLIVNGVPPAGFAIDEINPVAGTATFSPAAANNTFTQGSNVNVYFTCNDNESQIATCVGTGGVISGGLLNTQAVGNNLPFTVTATDKAGNTASATVNYSVVAAAKADIAIFEGLSIDVVKHGSAYIFPAWTLDLTKGVVSKGVSVTSTITIPTSTLGGSITGKYAIVSCSLTSGCSAMPAGAGCSVGAPVSSNGTTTVMVTCGPYDLQSVYNLQGARIQLNIPTATGAKVGSTFRIVSVVSSSNDSSSNNNTVTDTITVK